MRQSTVQLPVSVKGVLLSDNRVLLARNDRDEWELPGGRLEPDETPVTCVEREVLEETGIECRAIKLVSAECWEVVRGKYVAIISFGCTTISPGQPLTLSPEHRELRWFPLDGLDSLELPRCYRTAIDVWTSSSSSGV